MRLRLSLRSGLAYALVIGLLASFVPQAAFAQEGEKVAQVVITGNQNINREAIANVVKLAPGDVYTKAAIEKDRAAITALGYFSAVSVSTEATPDGLRVIYNVTETPIIKDIKIVGSGPVSEEKVRSLMNTKPGQLVNYDTLNKDIRAIEDYYREEGYLAIVTEDMGIDAQTGVLTIPILVHTVESVDIVGNKKTKEYVFLREMRTKPGKYYNSKVLSADFGRLYDLQILESIDRSNPVEPGKKIGTVDVIVKVTEKKTGQVSLGLGYSSREKLVGRVDLSESNFRGRGQGVTMLYETVASSSSGAIGGPSSYELTFHEPWIDKKNTSLTLDVYNKLIYRFASTFIGGSSDINGQSYSERRKGGSIGIRRPFSDFTSGGLTLRGESVSTTDIPSGATSFVQQKGDIRSASFSLTNDTRDMVDRKNPAVGWYKSATVELGRSGVTENDTPLKGPFQKLQIDVRHFASRGGARINPTDKRTTVAARIMLGVSSGKIPFFEQFFVGGADTVRGYREDRFWGNRMLVANVEYRKPFGNSLTGVVFLDYGDAWGTKSSFTIPTLTQHNQFQGSLGAGFGVRVSTPIGNLRLDYGAGKEGGKTYFSIGQMF